MEGGDEAVRAGSIPNTSGPGLARYPKFDTVAAATIKRAPVVVFPDNRTIWKEILEGRADVMITDATETRYWAKAHKGLCPINADKPFNFAEKAYLLPRDMDWKQFVDQWLHQTQESGEFATIAKAWIE